MGTLQLYIAAVVIVVVVVVVAAVAVVVVIGLIQYTQGRTKQSQGIRMKVLFVVAVVVCGIMKTSMGMGLGMVPPSYLRSAMFTNNSNKPVTVKVTFVEEEKGEIPEVKYLIQPGATVDVERSIDKGGYSMVNAIKSAVVVESGTNSESDINVSTVGIQRLRFNIHVQNGVTSLEREEM